MKHFGKYLAIGLSVAIAVAVGICYFVWSLHSLHRLIWFFIVFAVGAFAVRYMYEPDYVEYKGKGGKTLSRAMTKWEKIGVVIKSGFGIAIIGALVWTIGYGVACWFEWHPAVWELYLLYGVGAIAVVCLAIWLIWWLWILGDDFFHNQHHIREQVKNVLMWIVIVSCSLALAGVIIYLLLPLAFEL